MFGCHEMQQFGFVESRFAYCGTLRLVHQPITILRKEPLSAWTRPAIEARSWGGCEVEQISGQREEQIWRTVHTGVPEQGAAAGGGRGQIGREVGQPRGPTGFQSGFGESGCDTGHQGNLGNKEPEPWAICELADSAHEAVQPQGSCNLHKTFERLENSEVRCMKWDPRTPGRRRRRRRKGRAKPAIEAQSWGVCKMEQISGQREEQIWRTVHTGVLEQGDAAGGRIDRIGRVVGRPREATGFQRSFGESECDTGHQETENSDWSVEKIKLIQEAKIGKQEETLKSWRKKEELEKRRIEMEKREREELEKREREELEKREREELEKREREELEKREREELEKREREELEKREREELEKREREELEKRERKELEKQDLELQERENLEKRELEKREREELEKREREELEKQKIELEKWRREEELERQRVEEAEDNKLLEQEIREWEKQKLEREAELEKKKQEERLEIQKREAELKRQKQEEEQKRLTIEKEKFTLKKEEDHEQELLRQSKEQELQRQNREKALEAEGREWELVRQRKEAEKLERQRMEEERLERQRRQEEEKQEKQRREEELKRKRREWELKKRMHEEKLERERKEWAQEKQKREEELKKQEREEALKSQKAEKELIKQKINLDQLTMEREKELQDERTLRDIESINVEVKMFKGDFIGKNQFLAYLVKALYDVADEIDKDHKAAVLAGCAGAGLSVAGGVVAISGAALAPFTGGASLVATVGVGGSFLGSFTRIVGGVKENLDNTKREKTVDKILRCCQQQLQNLEDNYHKLEEKILDLEKRSLKDNHRTALESIKHSFFAFGPALKTELFKGMLKSIIQLTGRLVSRMVVGKVSQEVSHVATTTAAQEVTKRMIPETTNYFSYEAIKQFLTFSSKEVSKKWYQDVARTSAVASGAAAAIFLPFDVKDLYKDAVHYNKGAKSEIAEEIRKAARQLKTLINDLNEHL